MNSNKCNVNDVNNYDKILKIYDSISKVNEEHDRHSALSFKLEFGYDHKEEYKDIGIMEDSDNQALRYVNEFLFFLSEVPNRDILGMLVTIKNKIKGYEHEFKHYLKHECSIVKTENIDKFLTLLTPIDWNKHIEYFDGELSDDLKHDYKITFNQVFGETIKGKKTCIKTFARYLRFLQHEFTFPFDTNISYLLEKVENRIKELNIEDAVHEYMKKYKCCSNMNCNGYLTSKRCIKCKKAYYCSKTCQKTCWSEHKHECGKLL